MKPEMKKLIIANLPYLLFVYLFGKLGQAYRLAEGIDLSQKLLHFAGGCAAAFESAAPSFHPIDLLIGVAGAAALRLMVYCKGKNAKKYRKGVEYGSARCLYRSYRPAARQAAAARWISPHCCSGRKIDLPKYDTGLQGHRIPVNSAVVPCSRYSQGSAGKYITRRLPFCGSRRIHFSRLL